MTSVNRQLHDMYIVHCTWTAGDVWPRAFVSIVAAARRENYIHVHVTNAGKINFKTRKCKGETERRAAETPT